MIRGYRTTNPQTGFPLFAFRLHQFISRGDAVYASIEPVEERRLFMEGQVFVPGDRTRRLYPLLFCPLPARLSGSHPAFAPLDPLA